MDEARPAGAESNKGNNKAMQPPSAGCSVADQEAHGTTTPQGQDSSFSPKPRTFEGSSSSRSTSSTTRQRVLENPRRDEPDHALGTTNDSANNSKFVKILLPKGWRGGVSFGLPSADVDDDEMADEKITNEDRKLRSNFTTVHGQKIANYLVVTEVAKVAFSSKKFNAKNQLDDVAQGDRVVAVNGFSFADLAKEILEDGFISEAPKLTGSSAPPASSSTTAEKTPGQADSDLLAGKLGSLSLAESKNGTREDEDPRTEAEKQRAKKMMLLDMSLDDISAKNKGTNKQGNKGKKGKGKANAKATKHGKNKATSDSEASASASTAIIANSAGSAATGLVDGKEDALVSSPTTKPGLYNTCHKHPVQKHRIGSVGKFSDLVCSSCDFLRTVKQSGAIVAIPLWIRAVKDDDDTRITLTIERRGSSE